MSLTFKIPTFDDVKNVYIMEDVELSNLKSFTDISEILLQWMMKHASRCRSSDIHAANLARLAMMVIVEANYIILSMIDSPAHPNVAKINKHFTNMHILAWALEKSQLRAPPDARSPDVPLHDASASAAASGRAQGCAALEAGSVGPASAPAPTEDA